jgi:hypothetical protein
VQKSFFVVRYDQTENCVLLKHGLLVEKHQQRRKIIILPNFNLAEILSFITINPAN